VPLSPGELVETSWRRSTWGWDGPTRRSGSPDAASHPLPTKKPDVHRGCFEKFYAEDAILQENTDPPCVGKAANREREVQFSAAFRSFHGATLGAVAVADDVSFSEWVYDITFKEGGRTKLTQVARRKWRNGLVAVADECFYYKPAY
jgi:hypothetical protein